MAKTIAQKNTETGKSAARPPVIAVMGHIDHGKSTLLDYIRKTNIVDTEAGGITQHISSYEVVHTDENGNPRKITFLDTPGHAAFSTIRSRGVAIADIAILVVSAEDGVKPQTIEALNTIKSAGIPFIVAINKIDKPNADIDGTKQGLAEKEIYVEGYGGNVPFVAISAKTGEGVPELLNMMILLADLEDLAGETDAPAEGFIIESNVDAKKGISANLIIKNGTLSQGMFVMAAASFAPVRIMENFLGEKIVSATFSSPVRITGWSELPPVGIPFRTVESKKEAEAAASTYRELEQKTESAPTEATLENPEEERVGIPLIIKADTLGSLEAVVKEITRMEIPRVDIKIIHKGVGPVNEKDVKSADTHENTIIVSFSTRVDPSSARLADRLGVAIHSFDIIYKLTEWLEETLKEKTPTIEVEEKTGTAKIIRFFSKVRDRQIIGGKVEEGEISRGDEIKIIRRQAEIGRGKIRELEQQKAKASEVKEGYEFGAMIESKIEVTPGDRLEAFHVVTKK